MAKVVKNSKELETAMGKVMRKIMNNTGDDVQALVSHFLQIWYDDYNPIRYHRTEQFLKSCVRSKVIKRGNTLSTRIYIDYKNMHHIMHYDGGMPDKPLTKSQELLIVKEANRGMHGIRDSQRGIQGVKFWDDTMDEMEQRDFVINSFFNYLQALGFKAKYVQEGLVPF